MTVGNLVSLNYYFSSEAGLQHLLSCFKCLEFSISFAFFYSFTIHVTILVTFLEVLVINTKLA